MSAFTSIKNGKLYANNNSLREVKGSEKFKELLIFVREWIRNTNNLENSRIDIDYLLNKTKVWILTLVISFLLGISSSLPKNHFLLVYYEILIAINLKIVTDKEKVSNLFNVNYDILIRVINNKTDIEARKLIVLVLDFNLEDILKCVDLKKKDKVKNEYSKYLDDIKSYYKK